MAGYNDSEGPYTSGAPGFFTHLTHITDITNKFDKDATPATGDAPLWNGTVYAPVSVARLATANIFTAKQQFNSGGFAVPAGGLGTYDIEVYLAPAVRAAPTVQTVGLYIQHRVTGDHAATVHDAALFEYRTSGATNVGSINASEHSLVVTGGANTVTKMTAVIGNLHTEGTPTGTVADAAIFRATQVPSHGVPLAAGFTVDKVYGLYAEDQISGVTENYSIYSAGKNFFDRIVPKDSTGAAVNIIARSDTAAGTDLLAVKNSTSTTLMRVNSSGLGGMGGSISGTVWFVNANNVGGSQVALRVRGNSSQTVNLANFEESGGTPHVMVTAATAAKRANLVMGSAALATGATDGFLYASSMAGVPSGTPTTFTGTVPIVIDTTNSKLMAYIGGAWKGITLA